MTSSIEGRLLRGSTVDNYIFLVVASINIFFGFLRIIDALSIKYFYLYSPKVIDATVFSSNIDSWILLGSLIFLLFETLRMNLLRVSNFPRWTVWPCLLGFGAIPAFLVNSEFWAFLAAPLGIAVASLSLWHGFCSLSRRKKAIYLVLGVLSEFIIFEVLSLSTWVWNVFSYNIPFRSASNWRFALLDLQFFNVFYALTPWLFIVFLYGWAWVPIGRFALSKIRFFKGSSGEQPKASRTVCRVNLRGKLVLISLIVVVCAAMFVSYSPYVHLSSPKLVGVDSIPYFTWLEKMNNVGPSFAFSTDRPIFNLLMYSFQHAAGLSPEIVVRIMPSLCAVGLSLAVFWFVWEGSKNKLLALVSALFAVFSLQTVAGVFTYSVANWFAVIEAFVFLTLILKSFKDHVWGYSLGASVVGIVLLLTHPVTWYFVMAVTTAYFLWILFETFSRQTEERTASLRIAAIICLNLVFYAVYSLLPYGSYVTGSWAAALNLSGVSSTNVAQPFGLLSFANIPLGLQNVVEVWVGGVFGNPLLVALSVAGIFAVRGYSKRFREVLLLWVMVSSLVLFVGSPNTYFFYRVLYLVPFQVFAAAGFFWIFEKIESHTKFSLNKEFQLLEAAAFILIVLFFLNYSLRSIDSAAFYIPFVMKGIG